MGTKTVTGTGFTEDELALLSPEERAAIEATDDDAEDLEAIAAEGAETGEPEKKGVKPGPGDEEDDDDDDDVEAAAKAAAKEAAEEKAAAKAAREAELKKMKPAEREAAEAADAEAAAEAEAAEKARVKAEEKAAEEAAAKAALEAEDKEDAPRQRLPRYQAKPVENYEAQIKALDEAEAKALEIFQAGDSSIAELLKVNRECDTKRADLREQKTRYEMASEFNTTNSATEWQNDVQDFIAGVATREGIDYNKPLLNAALDTAVKALAADKANAEKSATWFLREAHKQVKAELGLVNKEPTAAEKAAAAKEAAAKLKGRKPALAVVKDVGALPSAGEDDPAGGNPEFVHLDNLTGQEFEDALAAMPRAKQEKYLRQQSG